VSRTVVVTGGCGFIGSHFVRLLRERTACRIVNIDKLTYAGDAERVREMPAGGRYHFVQGDIADAAALDDLFHAERPWAVVNFAAETHVDRSILDAAPFLQTNVIGVQALLEAGRRCALRRFVQVSTDEVYGDIEGDNRASEGSPLRPSSPYAAGKAAADLLCLAYARTHGLSVIITRGSNTYGPWQFPEKLIPAMIRHALAGEPLPLYGDGMQRRDWLYVTDHCEAILSALDRGQDGAVYNIATETERTNLEVTRALSRALMAESAVMPRLPEIRHIQDRPGHDRRYAMTVNRSRHELGWSPRVRFEEGLSQTVQWYLGRRDWLDRSTSGSYRGYYEAVYARDWGRRR
jgi:dTDP-glucose 4,6-dehydratase